MACDISPSTNESYYSGAWQNIRDVLRVMDIGEGRLAQVTEEMTNRFQERVDREIDDILAQTYHVPLIEINRCRPDGTTAKVFPGSVRQHAIYWTAALLLMTEFQGLSQNMTEQANTYIETARREMYAINGFTHRLRGQEFRSNISHTLPPTLQPARLPEANF